MIAGRRSVGTRPRLIAAVAAAVLTINACGTTTPPAATGAPPTGIPANSAAPTTAPATVEPTAGTQAPSQSTALPSSAPSTAPGPSVAPSSPSSPSPSAPTPVSTATIQDLIDGGVTIVDDETSPHPPARVLITRTQAQRLVTDLDWGIRGADLDGLQAAPAGTMPVSYLIAAWITSAGTPASGTASRWMNVGTTTYDWTTAPDIRYPWAVVTLFDADMARLIDENAPAGSPLPIPSGSATAVGGGRPAPAPLTRIATVREAPAGGPCSAVTNFFADAINSLFNALRITVPATVTGFFGDVARVLATVWNTAVGYAQRLVQGLIETITAPVFEAIRLAVGAVTVATMVVSYLVDQKLTLTVDPPAMYRFSVGAEADIKGQFVARPTNLTGQWPPEVVDCAQVAGASLPEIIKPGATATWTVSYFIGHVITPATLQTAVNSDLSVRLDFVTGHESDKDAEGDPQTGAALATVEVPRKEVGDFLDLGRQRLAAAEQFLTAQIPEPNLKAAAQAGLSKIVDPVVDELATEIAGNAPTIFTLRGTSEPLLVLFHKPPEETPSPQGSNSPTPKPSASQNGFCPKYRDYVNWAKSQGGGDTITRGQATEITVRFTDMRPVAPPELLSWVNLMISIYGRYAALPDNVHIPIVGADAAQIPAALNAMNKYCGLPALPV